MNLPHASFRAGDHRLSCGAVIGDILQPTHLLFILVIALLVLGPKRLPEVGRALGRGLRDFRNALNTDELREQMISTTTQDDPATHGPTDPTETPPPSEPPTAATAEASPGSAAPMPEPEPAAAAPGPDRVP
jgi:TatA/E family protein of Tat protein translocase